MAKVCSHGSGSWSRGWNCYVWLESEPGVSRLLLSQRTEHKGSRTQGGFAQCKTAVQRKEDVRTDSRLQHRERRRASMTFWGFLLWGSKERGAGYYSLGGLHFDG